MNKSRRLFLKVLTALATVPLLSKCLPNVEPLKIASHVWGGYELMFLARHEGWLSDEGVTLVETLSASDSMQALLNSTVHGAALTLDEMLRMRAQGVSLTSVLVFDVSAGADMVLAKTELGHLTDLTGKRIGFEPTALGALMLYELLQAAHLERSAIIPVSVNSNQHLTAWQQNKVDVVITYEPVATQLLNLGAYRIFDSRKIPDTIFDVLAIKTEILDSHAANIKSLVEGHFRARQYFYRNPQDASYKMAMRMKLSATEVLNSFRGLNLPNEQTNEKYLTQQNGSLLIAAQSLSNVMTEIGLLKQPDSLKNLVNDDFLPKIL